jgi:hypothetical protein
MLNIPDAANDPEAAALDENPVSVSVSDGEGKTVGIAVLLSPEIAAPEPELGAADEVVLA